MHIYCPSLTRPFKYNCRYFTLLLIFLLQKDKSKLKAEKHTDEIEEKHSNEELQFLTQEEVHVVIFHKNNIHQLSASGVHELMEV